MFGADHSANVNSINQFPMSKINKISNRNCSSSTLCTYLVCYICISVYRLQNEISCDRNFLVKNEHETFFSNRTMIIAGTYLNNFTFLYKRVPHWLIFNLIKYFFEQYPCGNIKLALDFNNVNNYNL